MTESHGVRVEIYPHIAGQLKAFADVILQTEVGEMTIVGFRIIQKDGGNPWVAFPKSSYLNKSGEQKERELLVMVPRNVRAIAGAILKAWKSSE